MPKLLIGERTVLVENVTIKRKAMKFDLQDFLPYQLNQAAEKVSRDFQSVYKREYGMLRTEWRVLFHLGHYGKMTARSICDRGNLHKTKVSRAVAALEEKRFLTRNTSANDRRHEFLELTSKGRSAFERLSVQAQEYQKELISRFSKQEYEALSSALKILSRTTD